MEPERFEKAYSLFLNADFATPFTLKLFDNRSLVIRDHVYPLDDLYCFVNGWYNLPSRGEVINNFTYLEELSDKHCNYLEKVVPGYFKLSFDDLTNESTVDETDLEDLMKQGGNEGYVPEWVVNGMLLHAAVKCVFRGGNRGAVCDSANCAQRACMGTDDVLKYTVRGECQGY